jgi:hypothetical protein
MTTETQSLSGWDRALVAARWCRDKAAGFITSFWLYMILWAVVGIAFTVLLYIDGKFSRGLATGLDDINPLSFQALGWAFRLFAAIFLMAAARCIYKGVKGALTFRLLGVFASVIVCLHAFGFGFQALSDRRDDAMAQREVVSLQADNSREQIALLTGQIDRIRADRDAQVSRLQASIDGIVNDGLNNDQLADAYRVDQTRVEDAASASIATLEAQITTLATSGNAARQSVTTTLAEAKPWPALYVGLAQLVTWSKEPSDWMIYLCGVGFIVAWVLLGESLVIFLPERIYLMHLRDADRPEEEDEVRYSDDVPEGFIDVRMTEEERKAYDEWKKRSDAAKLRAKIPIGNRDWIREKKREIATLHESGASAQEIFEATRFGTYNEFEAFVNRIFNGKAAARILGVAAPEEPDPRAAVSPSEPEQEAAPDPDLDIPPEPKDYPVGPYDPNRKPGNGADHEQA